MPADNRSAPRSRPTPSSRDAAGRGRPEPSGQSRDRRVPPPQRRAPGYDDVDGYGYGYDYDRPSRVDRAADRADRADRSVRTERPGGSGRSGSGAVPGGRGGSGAGSRSARSANASRSSRSARSPRSGRTAAFGMSSQAGVLVDAPKGTAVACILLGPIVGAILGNLVGGYSGPVFAILSVVAAMVAVAVTTPEGHWWVVPSSAPAIWTVGVLAELAWHTPAYQGTKGQAAGLAHGTIHTFPVMVASTLAMLLVIGGRKALEVRRGAAHA